MSAHLVLASVGSTVGTPLVGGIVNGAVYGLVALGIVLLYKAGRIFNFAQAEFGTASAFVTVAFLQGIGPFPKVPAPLAVVAGLITGGLLGFLSERLIITRLFRAPRATVLVATAGIALFLISLEAVLLGVSTPHVFPRVGGQSHFALFGTLQSNDSYKFGYTEITMVATLLVVAGLAALFFRTRYGMAILAVSQEPTAAGVVGINVRSISALTWVLAGVLGAVAGIVNAPFTGALTPGFMTLNGPLINGFIGAILGGITSFPGAFVGGLLVGVVSSYAGQYMPAAVPGGATVVVAALLLFTLLVRPTGLLGQEV
ncbi:MAG TPA: branched-chain amino acid ABC transporter permease [Acidimicrobiales bacterium]|nr:branched-chain amino acid ABC transporter permease [Acidimicrobiales bacterium]